MPIRTGTQFLEALQDDRQIFMDGERIRDIAHDPRTAGAAQTLAELYDMQHEPALRETMTREKLDATLKSTTQPSSLNGPAN